jgi:hypothetical protein
MRSLASRPAPRWAFSGLPSVVRAGKLVTLHRGVIRRALERLDTADLEAVDGLVRKPVAL